MAKYDFVIELIEATGVSRQTAEIIVERLNEEGLLHVGYGNAEVDIILTTFSETFGTTKISRYDRYAAHRLASKYGSQSICTIIKLLDQHKDDRYVPVIRNVMQLEDKIVSIIAFLRKNTDKKIDVLDG